MLTCGALLFKINKNISGRAENQFRSFARQTLIINGHSKAFIYGAKKKARRPETWGEKHEATKWKFSRWPRSNSKISCDSEEREKLLAVCLGSGSSGGKVSLASHAFESEALALLDTFCSLNYVENVSTTPQTVPLKASSASATSISISKAPRWFQECFAALFHLERKSFYFTPTHILISRHAISFHGLK